MMKKPVQKLSDDELRSYPLKGIVDDWFFRVDEISPGYYRVEGIDRFRRTVSRDGIDPDELIKDCRADIQRLFSGGNK
jgi:hypothetical protein